MERRTGIEGRGCREVSADFPGGLESRVGEAATPQAGHGGLPFPWRADVPECQANFSLTKLLFQGSDPVVQILEAR